MINLNLRGELNNESQEHLMNQISKALDFVMSNKNEVYVYMTSLELSYYGLIKTRIDIKDKPVEEMMQAIRVAFSSSLQVYNLASRTRLIDVELRIDENLPVAELTAA
jgi:hypothetical protein